MSDKTDESAISNALLRFFRCIVDNTAHGILAVLNVRNKKTVTKIQNEILLLPAVQLAAKIRQGELSSETLVRAYIDRILEVNDIINAVVDSRYAEALEEARKVDQLVRSGTMSDKQMSEDLPLLGIPFTAKAALLVEGLASDCGLVSRKGFIAGQDCESVKLLRSCGAIPIALTNTSEICLYWETHNKLHGRTCNPYDTRRTVGGSSGGEAALIAAAGSLIGLGADLGGSIRLPAFFNGIFGHKPTGGLVPVGGEYPPVCKELQEYFVIGPMVRYATDIKFVLSALIGKEASKKLKLFDPVDVHCIKIYYMLDDGGGPAPTPVSTDVQEGIKQIVNIFSQEGFVVKQVNLKYLKHGFDFWVASLSKIKEQQISSVLQGETTTKDEHFSLKEMCKSVIGKSSSTFPVILHAFAQDYLASFAQKRLDSFLNSSEKMKQELLGLLEPEPAVFLYPTYPHGASYHGHMLLKLFNVGYSVVFNAAQLPVTQCPLGLDSSGFPIGMQIVTAPNNDRISIAIAEYVENKLGGWTQPSTTLE